MKLLYILLALAAVLYLVGCYLAYCAVKGDNALQATDKKFGLITIVRRTLASWWTVADACARALRSIG